MYIYAYCIISCFCYFLQFHEEVSLIQSYTARQEKMPEESQNGSLTASSSDGGGREPKKRQQLLTESQVSYHTLTYH